MEPTGSKPTGSFRPTKTTADRRNELRHRVHSPAYTSLDGAVPKGGAPDLSEIVDISERGMSIRATTPLEVNRKLNLRLDLSETKASIHTPGQVIWYDRAGRAGIRFLSLAGDSLRELKQWLFANALTACEQEPEPAVAENGEWRRTAGPRLLQNYTQEESFPTVAGSSDVDIEAANSVGMRDPSDVDRHDRGASLQMLAERALAFTRASGAAIALADGNEMMCLASAGPDAPPVGARLQLGSGFTGACVRTGAALCCEDSEADDRVDREGCRALGLRSMAAAPIWRGNRVIGLVEVFSSQPGAFTARETQLLEELTGSILSAMGYAATVPRTLREGDEPAPPRSATARGQQFPQTEVLAGTRAALEPSTGQRLGKILLIAAAVTIAGVGLWLAAPWVSSRLRSAARTDAPPQQKTSARTSGAAVDITDLATLRKVAASGDPAAQFAMGARYATGEDVAQDYSEAVRWFSQAADRGHIVAQATLGAYYWAGRGVQQDLTKAYFWSVLAQAGGDQASKYRVAVLTSRMSRSQILAAQQQANDWLRNHQLTGNPPPAQ